MAFTKPPFDLLNNGAHFLTGRSFLFALAARTPEPNLFGQHNLLLQDNNPILALFFYALSPLTIPSISLHCLYLVNQLVFTNQLQ